MYSCKSFISCKNNSRKFKYNSEYNELKENANIYFNCPLEKDKCKNYDSHKDKANLNDSQTNFSNTSYKLRLSQILKTNLGGSVQFGNYYLSQYPNINYLGRSEGQPGGGGSPPKNKY